MGEAFIEYILVSLTVAKLSFLLKQQQEKIHYK